MATDEDPHATKVLDDVVVGNTFYIAQWKPIKCLVTFDGNGGKPALMQRTYNHGDKIGYLPTLDEAAID